MSDDTSTNSTYYPTFATATSGTFNPRVSSTKFTFNPNTGTLNATTVTASSDIKFKINIKDIENPLETVLKMRGVTFDRIDTGEKNILGFIAQELKEVLPNVVYESDNGLSISYQNITALLVEAIKQLNRKMDNRG
ncbi:MAG: tail fiber domain-containing protein [Betaproteobacteria bacterium]|nr:tail fiber domain-containing protein [Betaproteobacteria bacterium]